MTDTRTQDDVPFLTRVLRIFYLADVREDLLWSVTEENKISLSVNVSDIFAWGAADAEEITPETLSVLEKAFADASGAGLAYVTAPLYAARIRGMRPQGAAYPATLAGQVLFNACGPERPIGLGNPKPVPVAVDAPRTKETT
jgi:hypothetical protein